MRASFLTPSPLEPDSPRSREPGSYLAQPNHGLNCHGDTLWATNLLFGAPLEVDLPTWRPRRALRFLETSDDRPQVTSTAHFAWSLDGRHAYFTQSLLQREQEGVPVRAADLTLFAIDLATGRERPWRILPPPEDAALEGANFYSAFCFEERGKTYVGLLRTGAVIEELAPHASAAEHRVEPMDVSTVWVVEVDPALHVLQAQLLPGIRDVRGFALSHLDVDASSRDGFVLYANYKQSDVAEETHGVNVYGEDPEEVSEHYSGMVIEAFNFGKVIRYCRQAGRWTLSTFSRPYLPGRTSLGHSWLPINIQLDSSKEHVYCSFAGFRPRLLPRHVAQAYEGQVADVRKIAYVPPLLLRLDATSLKLEPDPKRGHLSYAEPVAFALVPGREGVDFVCTFSPEFGLRIYLGDDLNRMVAHAVAAELFSSGDTHFRPMPAHMGFVPR